jgi:hypothetical protein
MAEMLAQAREVTEISDAKRLQTELERVKADVCRLSTKAEESGDSRTALLQRVAMRMGRMALLSKERVL